MITIAQIEKEIAGLLDKIRVKKDAMVGHTKEKGQLAFLRQIVLYLETNPSERYLISEREKLETRVARLTSQYLTWAKENAPGDVPMKKRKVFYNKEMGINQMKKQIKTINFILSV